MIRLGATLPTSPPPQIDSVPNLLLDDYAGGVRAYSLRKLKKGYSGYILRLRRSADSEEVDVAFDDDNEFSADSKLYNASGSTADGTLLSAWMGMSAIYMTKWYDQSSAGLDITQSTALLQPILGAFGSFNTANGKTTVYFNGSTVVPLASTGLNMGSVAVYTVSTNLSHATTYQWPWGLSADVTYGHLLESGGGGAYNRYYYYDQFAISSFASVEDTQQIKTYHGGVGLTRMYQDGVAGADGIRVTHDMYGGDSVFMGAYNAAASLYGWTGNMQEFIVFDTDTSSDRVVITANLNDYYGTY